MRCFRVNLSLFCLLFAIFVGITGSSLHAEPPYLTITGWYSHCDDENDGKLLAGAVQSLALVIFPSEFPKEWFEADSLQSELPWIRLEFGYAESLGEEFVYSEKMTRLVELRYKSSRRSVDKLVTYYSIAIPREFGGTLLCVRAVPAPPFAPFPVSKYTHDVPRICRRLVSSCSREDEIAVQCSRLRAFEDYGEDARVLELADSLLEKGWNEKCVLFEAEDAALRLKQYQKAIEYLDRKFEVLGYVTPRRVSDLPPFQPFSIDSARERDTYLKMRESLLQQLEAAADSQ